MTTQDLKAGCAHFRIRHQRHTEGGRSWDEWRCEDCLTEFATRPRPDAEKRRMQGCCMDCGRKYGDEYGFPDLVVPDDAWKKLSPTHDDGGLLCPSCLCRRAHDAGIECEAYFRSGPFCLKKGRRTTIEKALADIDTIAELAIENLEKGNGLVGVNLRAIRELKRNVREELENLT